MTGSNTSEIPYIDRLGQHLYDAAVERASARERRRSPVPAMSLAGVLAVIAVTLVILWPRAESAQAFTITHTDGTVRVVVSNLVTDPDAATAQLQDAGLNARLRAVPVPDNLVGYVVSLSVLGVVDVELTRNANGVTDFEVAGDGFFVVNYGRPAADGETYVATQSGLQCAAWRNQRVADILTEIEGAIEVLRWQMFNSSTLKLTAVPLPDADAFVQDTVPLSANSAIIIVSDKQDSLPTSGDC